MDAMKMNQVGIGGCSIIDKEPNIDATRFFLSFERFQQTIMGWVHKSQ
jgi:hypothetical protein